LSGDGDFRVSPSSDLRVTSQSKFLGPRWGDGQTLEARIGGCLACREPSEMTGCYGNQREESLCDRRNGADERSWTADLPITN